MLSLTLLTPHSLQQHFSSSHKNVHLTPYLHALPFFLASHNWPLQSLLILNLKETWSLFLQIWLKWGRDRGREEKDRKNKGRKWEQRKFCSLSLLSNFCCRLNLLILFSPNSPVVRPWPHPPTSSFYCLFKKAIWLILILVFSGYLKAFVSVGMQTCSFIVLHSIWLPIFNGCKPTISERVWS